MITNTSPCADLLNVKDIKKKLDHEGEVHKICVRDNTQFVGEKLKSLHEESISNVKLNLINPEDLIKAEAGRHEEVEQVNACKAALEYHKNLFDLEIEEKENSLLLTVNFKDYKEYPIHFTVNATTNAIEDFRVTTICNPKQENALKTRYKKSKNLAKVLATLRAILRMKHNTKTGKS